MNEAVNNTLAYVLANFPDPSFFALPLAVLLFFVFASQALASKQTAVLYLAGAFTLAAFSFQMIELSDKFRSIADSHDYEAPLPHSSMLTVLLACLAFAGFVVVTAFLVQKSATLLDRFLFMVATALMGAILAWEIMFRVFTDIMAMTFAGCEIAALIVVLVSLGRFIKNYRALAKTTNAGDYVVPRLTSQHPA